MKKYDCQFSEDFQIAKHPDYCHKGNFQLQFNPEIKDEYACEEWGGWKFVSDMLNNPDENGIYPTSKCYKQLYDFVVGQKENALLEGRTFKKNERDYMIKEAKKEERENFRGLINDEILIAHKEGTATSRLTSLWMRLDK